MLDFEHLASEDPFVFKIKWVEIIVLQQRNGDQRNRGVEEDQRKRTARTL